MKANAFTLAPTIALTIATAVWADQTIGQERNTGAARAEAPLPIRWMPTWLLRPIEKAIADANDPRDRKPKR